MSWKPLLESRRIRRHETSREEIEDLRKAIGRDLVDAQLSELSPDRRFAIAYGAVLQSAKMILACAGYRVSGVGHHQTTFEALALTLGSEVEDLVTYFDRCRRKRNIIDYDRAEVASESEADELSVKAHEFLEFAEKWIEENHHHLARFRE